MTLRIPGAGCYELLAWETGDRLTILAVFAQIERAGYAHIFFAENGSTDGSGAVFEALLSACAPPLTPVPLLSSR